MFAIAVTDGQWFRNLRWMKKYDQVNFWNPRPWNVRGITPGQRWYFKLRQEGDVIAGYGNFEKYEEKSLSEAWLSYGEGNGCKTLDELRQTIQAIIGDHVNADYVIGCVVLEGCCYLPEKQFLHLINYGIEFSHKIQKYKILDQIDPFELKDIGR